MSDAAFDVVVAGAGVGGAALALALAQHPGLRILVVERRPGPGFINRGDSLLPAVTRHLAAWGALDRCRAAGARPIEHMQVFHHQRGFLLEAPLGGGASPPVGGAAAAPYLVLPHPEIERALADTATATGRVELRYRTHVAALEETGGRVTGVTLVDQGGQRSSVAARLVVGADGARSTVRSMLGIPLLTVPYEHGYFIIDLERPAAYRDAMRLELHPDGNVMIMPRSDEWVSLAVLVGPADIRLFRTGPVQPKVEAIWRRSPFLRGQAAGPRGAHLYALSRGHAPRYFARGAALIGDAVHVTNPTAGQGMTMAIEDAAALSRIVGPLLSAGEDVEHGLAAYEAERRPVNADLVRWSHWMGRFFSFGGPLGDGMRRRVFAFGQTRLGRAIHQRVWSRVATRKAS